MKCEICEERILSDHYTIDGKSFCSYCVENAKQYHYSPEGEREWWNAYYELLGRCYSEYEIEMAKSGYYPDCCEEDW